MASSSSTPSSSSSSSSSSSTLVPASIDLDNDELQTAIDNGYPLSPTVEQSIIDTDLAELGLVRHASSYDGNCFFTAALSCLRQLDKKYAACTVATLRADLADLFAKDMFRTGYALLAQLPDHTTLKTINRQSLYYVNWSTMVKGDNGLLTDNDGKKLIPEIVLKAAFNYALKLGQHGEFVDQYVACQLLASCCVCRVRLHSLHGVPPKLGQAVYYPFKDMSSKYGSTPMINIIYHSHHFEPAVPRAQPSSPSRIVAVTSPPPPLHQKVSVLRSATLGPVYTGAEKPFVLYAYDIKRQCYLVSDMQVPAPVRNDETDYLKLRVAFLNASYISPDLVYSTTMTATDSSSWFLFAVLASGERKLIGIAVEDTCRCHFELPSSALCLIAVNDHSFTVSDKLVCHYCDRYLE